MNEVLESENLQTFAFDFIYYVDTSNLEPPFNKHIQVDSANSWGEKYLQVRKYRNIAVDDKSALDEFVAEASVTIPKYLLHIITQLQ